MNIKKKYIFLIAALAIFFVCYIGILTLLTPIIGVTYFVTLIFDIISVGILGVIAFLIISEKESIREYFYQVPVVRKGMIYSGIQLAVGFLLTVTACNLTFTIIVELILLVILGGITLYAAFAGYHAKDVNDAYKEQISSMKALEKEARQIMEAETDYEWKRLIKGVWEAIHYAPPATTESIREIENEISLELGMLRSAVAEKNRQEFEESAKKIKKLLADRLR